MNFKQNLQKKYNYTDYQINLLNWLVITLGSEISKTAIIFLYFFYFHQATLYLWDLIIFWIMRYNGGGLHCKSYGGCLFFSFIYMVFSIQILPCLCLPKIVYTMLLLVCIIFSMKIGPIPSDCRHHIQNYKLSCYKINLFQILLLYCMIMLIIPDNKYLITGFWVIMIHTLQMGIAHLRRWIKVATAKLSFINTFYLKLMDIAKIMGWNGSCIFFFGEYPFPKE